MAHGDGVESAGVKNSIHWRYPACGYRRANGSLLAPSLPQAVPHLAGLLLPMQVPVGRVGELLGRAFAFDITKSFSGEPAVGFQGGTGRLQQVLVEWRVGKHQVEGLGRRAGQQGQGVLLAHLGTVAVQGLQMSAQGLHHLAAQVTGQNMPGAAGQGLQRQCSAAGEQVQAAGAFHAEAQPVEQGLTDPVRGRPQARLLDEGETAAAPLAGDDAQLAGTGLAGLHGADSVVVAGTRNASSSGCTSSSSCSSACGTARAAGPTVTTSRRSGSKCRAKAWRMSSVVSACTWSRNS